jgi:CMP-N,N'-diacetyllegionaminic acid synthase
MPQFKVAAIVIARAGSERLPNKNMLPFQGRPLVAHKVWQLKFCRHVDAVVVGSDSQEILSAAMKEGARTRLRAPEYCDEKSTTWNEVIYDMVKGVDAELILWAHCTNPNIQPNTYDRGIEYFRKGLVMNTCDSVVGVTSIKTHVWWGGKPLNFNPYLVKHQLAAQVTPVYVQKRPPSPSW